jgi:hypothetical protein
MSRKKWKYAKMAGLLIGCIVLFCIISKDQFSRPRPCKATFLQVREGMTMEEVIATVGGPPGDYRTNQHVYQTGRTLATALSGTFWVADDEELYLGFDENNRVHYVGYMGIIDLRNELELSWYERFMKWLGL